MKKSKKAQRSFGINDLGTVAIALVVAAVILGLGGTILDKVQDTQTNTSGSDSAYNTTQYGLESMDTMAQFIPTIAIVAVAAIIIGIILVFFGRGRG